MGRKTVNETRPALRIVDASIKPTIRRDNDSFLACGDSIHSSISFRKRLTYALPARAAVIAPEQPIASRGPEPRRMPQIHCEGLDTGRGNPRSSAFPCTRAVQTRPDSILNHGVKDFRGSLYDEERCRGF